VIGPPSIYLSERHLEFGGIGITQGHFDSIHRVHHPSVVDPLPLLQDDHRHAALESEAVTMEHLALFVEIRVSGVGAVGGLGGA
jgi:hypothetical protein